MFCICGFSMLWASSMVNFFTPMFTFSSNLVNLNDSCGNLPLFETFGLLFVAVVLAKLVDRLRQRWPSLTKRQDPVRLRRRRCMAKKRVVVHGFQNKAWAFVLTHSPSAVRYRLVDFLSNMNPQPS